MWVDDAAVLVPYEIWRLAHFGRVVPNAGLCKLVWKGDPTTLLRDFALLAAWTLPAAALLIALKRDRRLVAIGAIVAG